MDISTYIVGGIVTLAVSAICFVFRRILIKAEVERNENATRTEAIAHGLASLMRMQLVETHDKYMTQEWMPDTAKQSFEALFVDYEAMGENGIVSGYEKDIVMLPTIPPARKDTDP